MSWLLSCLPCVPQEPSLSINNTTFKIQRLLGEGGFSYVYLVSSSNGALYALKKIRCPFGVESVRIAMHEIGMYKEFQSPYIIRAVDSSVVQEEDGSKTVYILLPYFERSLQDTINRNVIDSTPIAEEEALRLFLGVCRGVQSMHRHHNTQGVESGVDHFDIEPDEHDALLDATSTNDDDTTTLDDATELQETVAYAHKDIKPANVMISKDGLPVLCDLGSCSKARVHAKTRAQAIALQELAAEHSTLPYRAPELLDVKTGGQLDEKIDIWSLGCLLYAMLFGCSPFEREEIENGGSINMAIMNAKYGYPESEYSEEVKEIIDDCLKLDPLERPEIETLVSRLMALQR